MQSPVVPAEIVNEQSAVLAIDLDYLGAIDLLVVAVAVLDVDHSVDLEHVYARIGCADLSVCLFLVSLIISD